MIRGIIRTPVENGRRIIAVSDVHAHTSMFEALLEKVRFTDDDILVLIGDMVECGPDSLGMLRRAMELGKKENVVILAGNWEDYVYWLFTNDQQAEALKTRSLFLVKGYGACLLSQMMADMGTEFSEKTDMAEILPVIREKYKAELEFMGTLPVIWDTGEFFFVHGGVPHLDTEKLSGLQSHTMMKWDHFADDAPVFDRPVIVGHWPVSLYDECVPNSAPHIDRVKNVISIDGGVGKKQDCQLNALIMTGGDTENFGHEYVCRLPVVRALEHQAPSEKSLHIRWDDRKIGIISEDGPLVKIRHEKTGQEMTIPRIFLWDEGWQVSACNATDYKLKVSPGDEIYVVAETDVGIFGKKDSITGWYKGRYEKKL